MLILGIDSSATSASAAVVEDGVILGEFYCNTKQTHSQTLLPMVDGLLKSLGKKCADFDLMAVSSGPGSFTGVRIGVSCVKGLALPHNTPCCGVSTLEAIAYGLTSLEGKIICAVMDARCAQVYNALFRIENSAVVRLCEDRALSTEELSEECGHYGDSLVLAGDGAVLCHRTFQDWGARLSGENLRFQRAPSVAFAAKKIMDNGGSVSAAELLPTYLRLPQAERELKKRTEQGGTVL